MMNFDDNDADAFMGKFSSCLTLYIGSDSLLFPVCCCCRRRTGATNVQIQHARAGADLEEVPRCATIP